MAYGDERSRRGPRRAGGFRPRRSAVARMLRSLVPTFGLVVLLAVSAFVYAQYRMTRPGPLTEAAIVDIERGQGVKDIVAQLQAKGVIEEPTVFALTAMGERALGRHLKAGEYEFQPGSSMRQVLALIQSGKALAYKVTIPEGLTSGQAMARIADHPALTGDVEAPPPEGALLPDTYIFERGTSREDLVRQIREAQVKVIDELWETRKPGLPIKTKEEAIILASIVEKETGVADERPRVAAVFVNRLKRGMRLQSDPTIIYGIVGTAGKMDRPITRSDISSRTAYNTYQIDGLPPTPIANPGRESIAAVLSPAETDELYFVADGTGGHVFARTLPEHEANVKRWRGIEREQAAAAAKAQSSQEAAAAPTTTGKNEPLPTSGKQDGPATSGKQDPSPAASKKDARNARVASRELPVTGDAGLHVPNGEPAPEMPGEVASAADNPVGAGPDLDGEFEELAPAPSGKLSESRDVQPKLRGDDADAPEGNGPAEGSGPPKPERKPTAEQRAAPDDVDDATPGTTVQVANRTVPLPRPKPKRP